MCYLSPCLLGRGVPVRGECASRAASAHSCLNILPGGCSGLAGADRSPPRSGQGLQGWFFCGGLVGTAQTTLGCAPCPPFLQCCILLMRHVRCYCVCRYSPGFLQRLWQPYLPLRAKSAYVCLAISHSSQTTNPNQMKGSSWFISII